MSTIKQFPNGSFQVRISSHLLDKPLYATFFARAQAESHGLRIEGLSAQGIVPKTPIDKRVKKDFDNWAIPYCIEEYLQNNAVPVSDGKLLDTIRPLLSTVSTNELNHEWCETWIRDMNLLTDLAKLNRNLDIKQMQLFFL